MKAPELLNKAANIMIERGKQYDKPEGERSMGAAVKAFNAITGKDLTEPEGWLLLQVLKDVRQWQNPDRYHADSVEDCIAYAALKGEALAFMELRNKIEENPRAFGFAGDKTFSVSPPRTPELGPDISFDSEHRIDQIGTNGNEGEHYKEVIDDKPSWDDAPEWAMWMAQDLDGSWWAFTNKPEADHSGWLDESPGDFEELGTSIICRNWRNTLEPRPTKESSK